MPRFRFFLFPPRAPPRPSSIPSPNAPASPRDPAAAPSAFAPPPAGSERQRRRGMAKARSLAKQKQAQQSNGGGGHALSSKLARYLDPEASLDKVRPARPSSCARARRVTAPVLTLPSRPGSCRTNCWTRCTGSARRWGSYAACSGEPSPSSAPSGSHCQFLPPPNPPSLPSSRPPSALPCRSVAPPSRA